MFCECWWSRRLDDTSIYTFLKEAYTSGAAGRVMLLETSVMFGIVRDFECVVEISRIA